MKQLLLLLGSLVFCLSVSAQTAPTSASETLTLVPESSSIHWLGKKVTGQHDGTVNIKEGFIKFEEGGMVESSKFVIDMNSIVNKDIEDEKWRAKLENHLTSDDFFNVSAFPTAEFEILSIDNPLPETSSATERNVTGKLTVKGISAVIDFPAKIAATETGYKAVAKVVLDRSKWDIRYNSKSFFDPAALGDKLIYDEIQITLNIVLKR